MSKATNTFELTLQRSLDASVERVWEALTSRAQLARWFGPTDEFRPEIVAWDFEVGGRYEIAMHKADGETYTCHGEFREITPPRTLAYTWSWKDQPPMDSLVTLRLEKDGDGTSLTLVHAGLPSADSRANHEDGWSGALERLAKLFG